jgi:hypothetical protein
LVIHNAFGITESQRALLDCYRKKNDNLISLILRGQFLPHSSMKPKKLRFDEQVLKKLALLPKPFSQ